MQTPTTVAAAATTRPVAVTWNLATGIRSMIDDVSDYRRMIENRRHSETLRALTRAVLVCPAPGREVSS